MRTSTPTFSLAPLLAFLILAGNLQADVVINEVLHDSEPNTRCDEFVELLNTGSSDVDLSGWYFSDGIDFAFPANTLLTAGSFVVVAQDPASVLAFHGSTALGPWEGGLQNEGESLVLRDAGGVVIDQVDYQGSFPWPTGAVGTGRSMELINPQLDNNLGGSWRESKAAVDNSESMTFLAPGQTGWRYRKGTSEASAPIGAWRASGFVEDASWLTGQTPMGYGDNDDTTILADMQNGYTSVYLRRQFTIPFGQVPSQLVVRAYFDDGAVVWINGMEVARFSVPGGELPFNGTAISHEAGWEQLTVPNAAGFLVEGMNTVAVHALNQTVDSSDFSVDLELKTPEPGAAAPQPSPGARNTAFAVNAPPQIRQVDHSPMQPTTTEATVITAKVTDPDGVAAVALEYQIVLPGAYIPSCLAKPHASLLADPNGPRTPNPVYHDPANWTAIAMLDDGAGSDAARNDAVFTATIPAQSNRTLVRYRITITDNPGASVRVPYPDDPSLNFACYTYDGVPDFIANTRSVAGTIPYIHPKEVLTTLPVYAMLTTQADFDQCVAYGGTQIPSSNEDARSAYNWSATFVYDGVVYDNIGYRLRQWNARYAGSGKRSFRFRFNDGNFIQLHDTEGKPYPTKWRNLNSHRMTGSRGGANFGLYEAANSALWNTTGSPAPLTHWFHFRVIKTPDEQPSGANGQHLGDFYGMLLAMEDYDVNFLDTHNLGRGNLYKLKTGGNDGLSVQRYQAKGAVTDASDFTTIINQLRNTQSDQWLRDHVNWDSYYRYKVIVDAVRHYDVSNGITPNNGEHLKNRSYFFQPDPTNPLGKLNLLPWDSDTSWGPNWNGGWDWAKSAMDNREIFNREYKNVVREFRDLVWQEDQIHPLLDRFEDMLNAFQLADRDRWTNATGTPNPGSQTDGPIAARVADMKRYAFVGGTWEGGSSDNRDFIYNATGAIIPSDTISRDDGLSGQQGRDAYLDALASDPAIPATPTLTYTGSAGFPTDGLAFEASPFSDPQGAGSFAAMEWRIAEIAPEAAAPLALIEAGGDWKFLDDGTDQGTLWRDPGFDDSTWASGPAPLGYGGITGLPGSAVTTPINFGPDPVNRYPTAYFRRNLQVTDPDDFESFTFKLHVDDGAILFVNGVEVLRDGFNAGTTVNFSSFSNASGNEGVFDAFVVAPDFFVAGNNVIAVEVHQERASSSDFVFDMRLEATLAASSRLLFEWEATWESGELAQPVTQIPVPAIATREGRLYRARVRYKDATDRWSHWSSPLQFTTTPPDIQPLLDNLVISEIMYHPAAPSPAEVSAGFTNQDEFEFIELLNISGSEALVLTDVRFTKGVEFDVPLGTTLPPGARVLVVKNRPAFELRFGDSLPVIGEFQSNLSNSGERLKLSFGAGTAIRDFDYDDAPPWPVEADGNGESLVLIAPESAPDHALPASWAASVSGGTPGVGDNPAQTYGDYLARYGIFDPDPGLDSDLDGLSNFLEFALAGNPVASANGDRPVGGILESGGENYLSLSFRRPCNPTGIQHTIEFSTNLTEWIANGIRVSSTPGPDETLVEVWRSSTPLGGDGDDYGRIKVASP